MEDIAPIRMEPRDGQAADSTLIFLCGLGDEGASQFTLQ